MKTVLRALVLTGMLAALTATAAFAAGPPDTSENAFVCPVLGGNAGENGNADTFVQIGGGDYSVIGPDVSVPTHATNDDGAGTPGGDHASPGDSDYTAIWSGE